MKINVQSHEDPARLLACYRIKNLHCQWVSRNIYHEIDCVYKIIIYKMCEFCVWYRYVEYIKVCL